ncbi:SDR family oxidoreductase [Bifidobacterium sp.]|jgi:NAD(P)H dehydrogenase (quinone)|uniref:SDR family oxidoreductase n=1 Tax=Bifidobacterium sp. TaxID=41200 RepID=UPI0025BD92AA|nr:SDR family oxidoreductase [Bifidobacterium sp.]MCH4160293.1 SDR family oxidoreductase [Bifidobacterium sp.]MCH4175190.1 SDR family oxidoreductase [Bifidobacterium sp.]MCI1634843.1 SDR family oxidoreductase [Bifidobacterium sp.]
MTYLVTGATGGLGGYALEYLKKLVPTSEIIALVRNEEKAATLKEQGITVRVGDYGDTESLKAAFTGVDRLLFISGAPGNRQAEHSNVVNEAKEAGVSFIAYTSFANANNVDNMLSTDHQFTEQLIERSGIDHTFLRNNWYLENETPLLKAALHSGELDSSAGDATVGWALKREYGEAAARVLSGQQDNPSIVELSGQPHTYTQLAEALSQASSKAITARDLDDQAFIEAVKGQGLPESAANGILGIQHLIKAGDLVVESKDFEEVLGHPLTSLEDGLKEILDL